MQKSSITLASDVNIINICMIYATFGLTSVEVLKKYTNSRTSYVKKVWQHWQIVPFGFFLIDIKSWAPTWNSSDKRGWSPGLNEQHRGRGLFRKPAGEDRPSWSASNYKNMSNFLCLSYLSDGYLSSRKVDSCVI